MLNEPLSPVDVCGCGDEGYLTTRTITVALHHGVGKIHNVPVYSCNDDLCDLYTIPCALATRLDDLAEEMEKSNLLALDFSAQSGTDKGSLDPDSALVQAFTWKFHRRVYEDARVILVIPGQTILIQSNLDDTEFYTLTYLPEEKTNILFSFAKFYHEAGALTYEEFITLDPLYRKELGILTMEEAEDLLVEEFGEIME